MPSRAKARARARDGRFYAPLDDDREREEYFQRPEEERRRIYHMAGRFFATFRDEADDPDVFIGMANRFFREEPDLAATLLEDYVPPPPTEMEIRIQLATELIAAAVAELDAGVGEAHEAMDDPAQDSSALRRANNHMAEAYRILSQTQIPEREMHPPPFAGQGHRLGEP